MPPHPIALPSPAGFLILTGLLMAYSLTYYDTYTLLEVDIASGQTTTESINLMSYMLCSVHLPSGFVGTALQFEASLDGSEFLNAYETSTLLSITCAASRFITLDVNTFMAVRPHVKIKSNLTQVSDVTLRFLLRKVQ